MNPLVCLESVSKRFGRQTALERVSLQTPPGSVVALLGENGAGKTTLVRIILGLTNADEGQVQTLGLDPRVRGAEIRRRVGYVPERPVLYDWMTVSEIGWFAAGFYDDTFLPRYQSLVGQYELPPDRRIKALSKGMRAKVSLALALAPDPQLLILDEPTSGLDVVVRREFLESMVALAAEGRTVLLASHQINEVERVADVVAVLHNGKLLLEERLEEFKNEVRQLTVTMRNGAVVPTFAGELLAKEQRDRQYRMLVRRLTDEAIETLRAHETVSDVAVRTPTLEEILVAYMRPARPFYPVQPEAVA